MSETFRWGILGTGRIAKAFAQAVIEGTEAEVAAVGSRHEASADAFADQFDIPTRYDSYEALAGDPTINAVYIATPHVFHKENSILCLEAGKHVLCEKPFTINAGEAEEVVAVARREKCFLMEAMWTRFVPLMVEAREMVESGCIGQVKMLQADFAFPATFDAQGRLFDLALGGGALLDVGVYPVSLASMIFGGQPDEIAGHAQIGPTGVDELAGMIFKYAGGGMAVLSAGITVRSAQRATIMGTDGTIEIDTSWWKPRRMILNVFGQDPQPIEINFEGNGYQFEAVEVQTCVEEGKLESDTMPLDETLAIMKTMDRIRQMWGLRYPSEK